MFAGARTGARKPCDTLDPARQAQPPRWKLLTKQQHASSEPYELDLTAGMLSCQQPHVFAVVVVIRKFLFTSRQAAENMHTRFLVASGRPPLLGSLAGQAFAHSRSPPGAGLVVSYCPISRHIRKSHRTKADLHRR